MSAACVSVNLVDENSQTATTHVDRPRKSLVGGTPPLSLLGRPNCATDAEQLEGRAAQASSRTSKEMQLAVGLKKGAAAPVCRSQPHPRRTPPADPRQPQSSRQLLQRSRQPQQTSRPPQSSSRPQSSRESHVSRESHASRQPQTSRYPPRSSSSATARLAPTWCMRKLQGSPSLTPPTVRGAPGPKISPIAPLHMERSPFTPAPKMPAAAAELHRLKGTKPSLLLRDGYSTSRLSDSRLSNSRPSNSRPSNSRPSSSRLSSSRLSATPGTSSSSYDLYRRERTLGKGAFGMAVAIKTIDRTKLFSNNLKKTVENEIRVLKRLRHPGAVRLFEVIDTPRYIHLVLECLSGGNLQQLLKAQKRIGEPQARGYLWQLLDTLEYCHSRRVCHRDLKLENFVLDAAHRRVKLIDFGLSVVWREDGCLFKSYGTPCYSAPEISAGKSYLGPQVDVWSLGVCLCTMLSGSLPFQGATPQELKSKVLSGRYALPDHISADARDVIAAMLTVAPEGRATIPALRMMRWLEGCSSEMPPKHVGGSADVNPELEDSWVAEYSCSDVSNDESTNERASTSEPTASSCNVADEETPLDPIILGRLRHAGLCPQEVERSVRAAAFDHQAACYEMLLAAAAHRKSAGGSTATNPTRSTSYI